MTTLATSPPVDAPDQQGQAVTPSDVPAPEPTAADWYARLGRVPLGRVLMDPKPGTATAADAVHRTERVGPTELIHDTLVEKAMGRRESMIAAEIIRVVANFVREHRLGQVAGPDGTITMIGGNVRVPDVSFTHRDDIPEDFDPNEAAPRLPARFVVEVLSPGNTAEEIDLKLRELFAGGTRLAWVIDPRARTVRIYTSPEEFRQVGDAATLDGGDVLPGFSVKVAELLDV